MTLLPRLNERGEDILLLSDELLKRISQEENKAFRGLTERVAQIFQHYSWPGNVRELENVLRNIVVLNQGEFIEESMLPGTMFSKVAADTPESESINAQGAISPVLQVDPGEYASQQHSGQIRPLWLEEKEIIERAIAQCDDNIAKAATLLEISPSTIYRKRAGWEKAALNRVVEYAD